MVIKISSKAQRFGLAVFMLSFVLAFLLSCCSWL